MLATYVDTSKGGTITPYFLSHISWNLMLTFYLTYVELRVYFLSYNYWNFMPIFLIVQSLELQSLEVYILYFLECLASFLSYNPWNFVITFYLTILEMSGLSFILQSLKCHAYFYLTIFGTTCSQSLILLSY